MTNWVRDHATGVHEDEITGLMDEINECLIGHPRIIGAFALLRMMAVMLGPASAKSRESFLAELVPTLQNMLAEMDRLAREQGIKP